MALTDGAILVDAPEALFFLPVKREGDFVQRERGRWWRFDAR